MIDRGIQTASQTPILDKEEASWGARKGDKKERGKEA